MLAVASRVVPPEASGWIVFVFPTWVACNRCLNIGWIMLGITNRSLLNNTPFSKFMQDASFA